jgi:hypothetical protein
MGLPRSTLRGPAAPGLVFLKKNFASVKAVFDLPAWLVEDRGGLQEIPVCEPPFMG